MLILRITLATLRQHLQINLLAVIADLIDMQHGLLLPSLLCFALPTHSGLLNDLLHDILLLLLCLQLVVLSLRISVKLQLVVESNKH